ncbi:MAG: dUTP diphosphatase [Armatimonadota bacterium]|nr:dUTP diphosphatase [bacterium]MDW8320676.1 dUTP diphosphatase [Armatimonadota bacterium]
MVGNLFGRELYVEVNVLILREPDATDLPLPQYTTPGAAGADLYAAVEQPVVLQPGERRRISTGIRIALPSGYEAQVRPRSGLADRYGLGMVNAPGTIDSDYRGVIQVVLINLGHEPITIHRGDRVAQLVIAPVARAVWQEVDVLPRTERAEGGFGSTGVSAEK